MLAWALQKNYLHCTDTSRVFYNTYQSHIFRDIFVFYLSSCPTSPLHYYLMILWKHIIKFFINTTDLSRVFVNFGIGKCLSTLLSTHFNYKLTTSCSPLLQLNDEVVQEDPGWKNPHLPVTLAWVSEGGGLQERAYEMVIKVSCGY